MTHEPEQLGAGNSAEGKVTLPVHREELQVGTREVDTGRGVRVHKRVAERPQHIEQLLWRDELDVQHVAVGTVVSAEDLPSARYEGDTLIVPVLEEVLVVEKRYRIKEELHITRTRREHHHAETVTLKSEDISVEWFDESSGTQKPGTQ